MIPTIFICSRCKAQFKRDEGFYKSLGDGMLLLRCDDHATEATEALRLMDVPFVDFEEILDHVHQDEFDALADMIWGMD